MAQLEGKFFKTLLPDNGKEGLPLISLKDIVLFPHVATPLAVNRPQSIKAVEAAMDNGQTAIFVAQKKPNLKRTPTIKDLYTVGSVGKVREMVKEADGTLRILAEGTSRAKLLKVTKAAGYQKALAEEIPKLDGEKTENIEALMYSVVNQFKESVSLGATVPLDVLLVILNVTDPVSLADLVAINLDFKLEERQHVLEAKTILEKLELVNDGVNRQLKVLRIAKKLEKETGKEIEKMQREMFLREQLKSIEKELGTEGGHSELDEMRQKVEKAHMPKEAKKMALKEIGRLGRMPSFSPEISYIRTYLDWLINLPWDKKSEGKINIKQAKASLDQDHYGLDKAKERILEYLAVQKMVGKIKGPILCFVGPPGTGKTSIGKSIAKSMGREFVRISLGGIHDEAEIRGHRRTYVGALPGRIIQGIKSADTINPIFMLDEIDKLGSDFRGDPSAALLEALDPEQNYSFADHYLEVPMDLSDVMFITTANVLDTIPPALRDRMEIISFPGYIEDEKFNIAKKFLLPKQYKNHGLAKKHVVIRDSALRAIVREYTREAGVRNLEREIAKVLRKVARSVAEGKKKKHVITTSNLSDYLGPARFKITMAEKKDEVGVSTGLAWTEAGGDILFIEATKMPGKGKLILTGHLGEVMQESARAAFSYARSKAAELGIKDKIYKDFDVHIHVPSGAIPKDGPSAGVAMTTALVSLLTDRPVKRSVGMTGEITLRGHVLEIGGVKEKVLAAHRSRLKTIILPKSNKKDLAEIPKDVRKGLNFVFADTIDQVLDEALKGLTPTNK